jgi:hypothetical protein
MDQIEIAIEIVSPDREVLKAFDKAFEGADGHIKRIGPKGLVEFLPDIQHLIGYAAGIGGGAAALKGLKDVSIAWIKAREGRKITLTVGGKKVEVRGGNAFDEATKLLQELGNLPAQQEKAPQKPRSTRGGKGDTGEKASKARTKAAKPRANKTKTTNQRRATSAE